MKVFITGGGGFLGHHLLPLFDNANIEYWAPTSKDVDILNAVETEEAVSKYNPNIILHLAAKCAGIKGNFNNPAVFLRDNTQMALNIYEAARKANVPYVYSLGSVCSYPKFCPVPFNEDDIWNGAAEETNFPYSQAKRTLLMLSQTYRTQYGIKGAHLIPVNMYGEHDNFDPITSHVIPALIRKFVIAVRANATNVQCWGSGKNGATREFLYAGDCSLAIIKAITTNFDYDGPINLGVGKDILIYDLAHLIAKLTGFHGNIEFDGKFDGQPRRLLNVSRAKQLLGWTAQTDLEDGLRQTIDWYIQNCS